MNCLLVSVDNKEVLQEALNAVECIQDVYIADDADSIEETCIINQPEIIVVDNNENDSNYTINLVEKVLPKAHIIAYTDYQSFSFENEIANRDKTVFLLRPCDTNILSATINRIASGIELAVSEEFSPTALSDLVNDYIPIIRQHYLSMILRREMPQSENILQKFTELKISCPGPYYTVVVSSVQSERKIANYEAICFLLRTHIKNEMIAKGFQCYIFFDSNFNINCLVGSKEKNIGENIETILNTVKKDFEYNGDFVFCSGIGRTVEGAQNIHSSFEDAESADVYARDSIYKTVLYSNIKPQRRNELEYDKIIKTIKVLLLNHQNEKLEKSTKVLFQKLENENSVEITRNISIKLIISCLDSLETIGVNLVNYQILPQLLAKIYTTEKDKDICEQVKVFFSTINVEKNDVASQRQCFVNDAIAYIDSNLSNPNMSLDMIGQHLNLSKSYFCMIFKDAMGCGFSDYLRNLRVERAKLLLCNSNKKTYEISTETGFRTPKYFSSVFKSVTGVTPSEYQKMYKKL